jgi:hypothetical protein
MHLWLGLILGFVSALSVNWAYVLQHDAAASLPKLSPRHPLASALLLARNRAWLVGFGFESVGWLLYVAALAFAPLALVQAVGASGIAVLALAKAHGDPRRLALREQLGTVAAIAGLVLLSVSLVGVTVSDERPQVAAAVVWLGGLAGAAVLLSVAATRFSRTAMLGLSAGALFAGGDISVKLVVLGGWWFLSGLTLIGFYAFGTLRLQTAFQSGNALTGAGLATLMTNALPIAAGFALFGEGLPNGFRGVLQISGFVLIIGGAIALADKGKVAEPVPV